MSPLATLRQSAPDRRHRQAISGPGSIEIQTPGSVTLTGASTIGGELLVDRGTLYGPDTRGLVMSREDSLDIDDPFDLDLAELLLAARAAGRLR